MGSCSWPRCRPLRPHWAFRRLALHLVPDGCAWRSNRVGFPSRPWAPAAKKRMDRWPKAPRRHLRRQRHRLRVARHHRRVREPGPRHVSRGRQLIKARELRAPRLRHAQILSRSDGASLVTDAAGGEIQSIARGSGPEPMNAAPTTLPRWMRRCRHRARDRPALAASLPPQGHAA